MCFELAWITGSKLFENRKRKEKKNQKKNQKIKKSNPNAQIIAIGPVEISTSKYSSDPFNGRDPSKTYLW